MVVGALLALVAFFVVIVLGGRGGGGGQSARNVDVVVAAVDIPAGTTITQALLATVKYAPDQLPTGYHSKTADVINEFAAVALPKNTPLTSSNLVTTAAKIPAAKKPYLDIPSGQVAIAIPAGGEIQAVGGFIQPDDRIDIIWQPRLTPPPANGAAAPIKTTFQNLRVAHVGPVTSQNVQGLTTSLIVFVTLDDAEALMMLFITADNYKLALTSQKDAPKEGEAPKSLPSKGVKSEDLLTRFNYPR